jgi:transposase-like protein
MQMLHPLAGSIQQYLDGMKRGEELGRFCPASCPLCHSKQTLVAHGFYSRTVVDVELDCEIRVQRFRCRACRRTVSLLPEFVLPYLRFTVKVIALFLAARLAEGKTLKAAAVAANQPTMPYQRGQHWVRRFRGQAERISAALTGLIRPSAASDFVQKALSMLERAGWFAAHRFLFEQLRAHLLGWPDFLAPAGLPVTIRRAVATNRTSPQSICMDAEPPPA